MGNLQYIPSFYFYKFAHAIAEPYTNLSAYKSGFIDERGNVIGNETSIDPFEYFVIKIKKIFEELPPGVTKYKTGNLFGVMQLFSEEAQQFGINQEDLEMLMEAEILSKQLVEDMSTSSTPGGIGTPAEAPETNKGNVSGYDPRMNTMMTRSDPVNMFGAVEMFSVPSNEFKMFKFSKYYPKTSTGNYLRRLGHRNPGVKMAIKDEETGEVYWLPDAKKKTITEEYFLKDLKILNEASDYDEYIDIAKKIDASPVEPSEDNARRIFQKQIDVLTNAIGKGAKHSETIERSAAVHGTISSAAELSALLKSPDPRQKNLASWYMGVQDKLADRPVSSSAIYDITRLQRSGDRIVPKVEDVKTSRFSASTPVPPRSERYGGLMDFFGDKDPFEIHANAIEHGGNLEFVEDKPAINLARKIWKDVQRAPGFQEKALEMATSHIGGKNIPLRFARSIRDPGIELDPQRAIDLLKGREFRAETRYTGKRVGPYKAAMQDYEEKMKTYRGHEGEERPKRPRPAIALRRLLTKSNAITQAELDAIKKSGGTPDSLDQKALLDIYGQDILDQLDKLKIISPG